MLERADHALVRADGRLPGLALVLDPECVHEQVAAAVGACGMRLDATSVEYLRYKPGTSVVATVRVRTDAGSSLGYVRAWSRERGAPEPVVPEPTRPSRRAPPPGRGLDPAGRRRRDGGGRAGGCRHQAPRRGERAPREPAVAAPA